MNIMGFNQEMIFKYNLDLVDIAILKWFIDLINKEKLVKEIIDGKIYYWVYYKKLLDDMPILKINNKDVIRRRMKIMEEKSILIHYTKKKNGTYSYYNIGKNYKDLIESI